MNKYTSFLVASSLTLSSAAFGACQLKLDVSNGPIDLATAYASAMGSDVVTTPTVKVRNEGADGCDYVITISTGNAGTAEPRKLKNPTVQSKELFYNIYDPTGKYVLKDTVTDTAHTLTGTIAANAEVTLQPMIRIPHSQLVPYREDPYTDTLDVKVYDKSAPTTPHHDMPLVLNARVKPELRAAFNMEKSLPSVYQETTASYELAFDELKEGLNKRVSLYIESNDGYEVTFVSEHKGTLKHREEDVFVPYTLTIEQGGTVLTIPSTQFASPFTLDSFKKPSGTLVPKEQGEIPLSFTIGSTQGALAGSYMDVVTVVVRNPD